MATLTIIGAGAHSKDIQDGLQGGTFAVEVITHHTEFDKACTNDVLIAVNDPQLRYAIAQEIERTDWSWQHFMAYMGPDCQWGWGTHINYGVTMVRTTIGHHCTISPGVTICGDVTIGDRVLVGAGAVICDRVTIGNDVTIGAGTIILPESHLLDGETWVGNPGRRIER